MVHGSVKMSLKDLRSMVGDYKKYGGHNSEQITKAIQDAKDNTNQPTIVAKTTIGFGSPNKADTSSSHGAPLGDDEIKLTRKIGLGACPFEILIIFSSI